MMSAFWQVLLNSAIYILFGFLIAGVIQALFSSQSVAKLLSGNHRRSVLLATLIGIPLPLCSCAVLPAALTLRKKGASKGAVLSFLISTPETGVTSILLTYALLGPLWAIFRPVAACVTAICAGIIENAVEKRRPSPESAGEEPATADTCAGSCQPSGEIVAPAGTVTPAQESHDADFRKRIMGALRYAYIDLFDDIFGWIVVGIAIAAAIQALMPPAFLQTILGGPARSMFLMALIGVPLYVCAEASTPIAAALVAQGVNPGAALVLLLTGPATNVGALGLLYRRLGRRTTLIYLVSIVLGAWLMGALLNDLLARAPRVVGGPAVNGDVIPQSVKVAGALAFLALGIPSLRRQRCLPRVTEWINARVPVRLSPTAVGVAPLILSLVGYVASGFFVIRPGEMGIVRRLGVIQHADVPPGLHYALPFPIARVDRAPMRYVDRLVLGCTIDPSGWSVASTDPNVSWSLVGDENIADLKSAVHWGATPGQSVRFQFSVADRDGLVCDTIQGALREVLAGESISDAFTVKRQELETRIRRLAQQRLDEYGSGITIFSFHLLDAHAPPDVHAAFRDVASALEDRATKINTALKQEAEVVPQARGEAVQRNESAAGYTATAVAAAQGAGARFLDVLNVYRRWQSVTRERLYLEALDTVLPRVRKYITPADETGEVEIWFIQPQAQGQGALKRVVPVVPPP